jgi:hypothetical protein
VIRFERFMRHHPVLRRLRSRRRLAPIGLVLIVAAFLSGSDYAALASNVLAPPEIAANAATGWPEHNFDLANSRADLEININATNVATLKQKWAFKLRYSGLYGPFTSNPTVLDGDGDGDGYFEDPDSDVFALKQCTGALV